MKKRCSGILMPVSSLPGGYGIGSMGQAARDFVDFLVPKKIGAPTPITVTMLCCTKSATRCCARHTPHFCSSARCRGTIPPTAMTGTVLPF